MVGAAFAIGYATLLTRSPRQKPIQYAVVCAIAIAGIELLIWRWGVPAANEAIAGAMVDAVIDDHESWRLLSERHSEFRIAIRKFVRTTLQSHDSVEVTINRIPPQIFVIEGTYSQAYIQVAPDADVVEYFDALRDVIDEVATNQPAACDALLRGEYTSLGSMFSRVPKPLLERFSRAYEAAIVGGFKHPSAIPDANRRRDLFRDLADRMTAKYGDSETKAAVALLLENDVPISSEPCRVARIIMHEAATSDPRSRPDLVRLLLASGPTI